MALKQVLSFAGSLRPGSRVFWSSHLQSLMRIRAVLYPPSLCLIFNLFLEAGDDLAATLVKY